MNDPAALPPPESPTGTLAASAAASRAPDFFSLSDRIGRLRYFTYIVVGMTACGLLLIPVYILALLLPDTLGKLVSSASFVLAKNVLIPLVIFVMTIRRLHDINASGWWALTIVVPFATVLFLLIPGSRGANRFGPCPGPNSSGLVITAVALPAALVALYFFTVRMSPVAASSPTAPSQTAPGADRPLPRYDAT